MHKASALWQVCEKLREERGNANGLPLLFQDNAELMKTECRGIGIPTSASLQPLAFASQRLSEEKA